MGEGSRAAEQAAIDGSHPCEASLCLQPILWQLRSCCAAMEQPSTRTAVCMWASSER